MEHLHWDKRQKISVVLTALKSSGYAYKHPTFILEGADGWFAILTPDRAPHQAIVHIDRKNKMDFLKTIPELLTGD